MIYKDIFKLNRGFARTFRRRKASIFILLLMFLLCFYLFKYKYLFLRLKRIHFACGFEGIKIRWDKPFDIDDSFLSPTDEGDEIPNTYQLQGKTLNDLSIIYRRYISTLQGFCRQPKRFGNISYGGQRICADSYLAPTPGCVVHSINFGLSELFKAQIKRKFNSTVLFHGKPQSADGLLKIAGNNRKSGILIFKIGQSDFSSLPLFSKSLKGSDFKQIILEIHHEPSHETKEGYMQLLEAFRELRTFCAIYWYDRNSACVELDVETNMRKAKCFTVNMFCNADILSSATLRNIDKESELRHLSSVDNTLRTNEMIFRLYASKHQILCNQVRRMGNIVDGGWDVCNDVQFRPRSPCLVYSFGIGYDFSFDEAIEKVYGCEVFSFDPTMDLSTCSYSKHIHFYDVGLGDKDGVIKGEKAGETMQVKRLETIMKEFSHEDKRIDVLKIDIEGHEKESLVDMISSGALKNVAQLCVEFHSFTDLSIPRKLYDLGFRIFWTHQNEFYPVYLADETLSHGSEVSFVNINLF